MANQKNQKREIKRIYLLTHPFFTLGKLHAEDRIKKEDKAVKVIERTSANLWKRVVKKAASEPKSVLVLIPPGNLGPFEKHQQNLLKHAKKELGDRYFQASKKTKLSPTKAHKFYGPSFDGYVKNKGFKFSKEGVSIEAFGEPVLKEEREGTPRERFFHILCASADLNELVKHLKRKGIKIKKSRVNTSLRVPSLKVVERVVELKKRKSKRKRRKPPKNQRRPRK